MSTAAQTRPITIAPAPATADLIVGLYNRSKIPSIGDIAKRVGVSRQLVSRVLKERGLKTDFRAERHAAQAAEKRPRQPKPRRPFLERSPAGQIVSLLGLTYEQASEHFGTHEVTMARYCEGAVLPPEYLQLYMLATLGLGAEAMDAAVEAGRKKLKAAVDTAEATAKN
jgi:hypothetical protein